MLNIVEYDNSLLSMFSDPEVLHTEHAHKTNFARTNFILAFLSFYVCHLYKVCGNIISIHSLSYLPKPGIILSTKPM